MILAIQYPIANAKQTSNFPFSVSILRRHGSWANPQKRQYVKRDREPEADAFIFMKILPSKETKAILVNDEDFERLSKYNWHRTDANETGVCRVERNGDKLIRIPLANEVMQKFGIMFDHKNRDPFDNRKNNLREATQSQNMANKAKVGLHSSPYKGVSWLARDQRWIARVVQNGKPVFRKAFKNEEDAARAYNEQATKFFGEFAVLNEIPK